MALNPKIPSSRLPAKKTLDIIQKASGKPMYKVKNFYKDLDSKESQKIKTNIKHNALSKKEVKQLIRDSEKEGLYINETRLRQEFDKIAEKEKKRKLQYSKGRAKLSARLERIKSGEESELFRKFKGSREERGSSEERKKERSSRVRGVISDVITKGSKKNGNQTSSPGRDGQKTNDSSWSADKKNSPTPKKPLDLQID